jgi:hypothetical protein
MDDADDQYDQGGDVVKQLRQLAWAVPISRDHMLKVVEGMPPFVHERARSMAERLTFLCTRLQGLLAELPDDVALPASIIEDLDCLRRAIGGSLRDLDLLLADLRSMLLEPDDREMCSN